MLKYIIITCVDDSSIYSSIQSIYHMQQLLHLFMLCIFITDIIQTWSLFPNLASFAVPIYSLCLKESLQSFSYTH